MAIKTWFWSDGYNFSVDNLHVPGAWKMYKTLCKIQKNKTFKV